MAVQRSHFSIILLSSGKINAVIKAFGLDLFQGGAAQLRGTFFLANEEGGPEGVPEQISDSALSMTISGSRHISGM